jgi:hypothetical protein
LAEDFGAGETSWKATVQRIAQKRHQCCDSEAVLFQNLTADITRVKAARDGCVGSPFDNGPSIGKERHFVWLFPKLEDEIGVANAPVWLKTFAQVAKIDRPVMLMNLDGIASAKRNVRSPGPRQMHEIFLAAGPTI